MSEKKMSREEMEAKLRDALVNRLVSKLDAKKHIGMIVNALNSFNKITESNDKVVTAMFLKDDPRTNKMVKLAESLI